MEYSQKTMDPCDVLPTVGSMFFLLEMPMENLLQRDIPAVLIGLVAHSCSNTEGQQHQT